MNKQEFEALKPGQWISAEQNVQGINVVTDMLLFGGTDKEGRLLFPVVLSFSANEGSVGIMPNSCYTPGKLEDQFDEKNNPIGINAFYRLSDSQEFKVANQILKNNKIFYDLKANKVTQEDKIVDLVHLKGKLIADGIIKG
jgi:hypothetical protein